MDGDLRNGLVSEPRVFEAWAGRPMGTQVVSRVAASETVAIRAERWSNNGSYSLLMIGTKTRQPAIKTTARETCLRSAGLRGFPDDEPEAQETILTAPEPVYRAPLHSENGRALSRFASCRPQALRL